MKYRNGKDALPPELLTEIQKYLDGEMLYIPRREGEHAPWGQNSGSREQLRLRNAGIAEKYRRGISIDELTEEFCLSEASIRKIVS